MKKALMNIGVAAERCGLSKATLRRYENRGWITPARSWNGYRVFTEQDVARLRAIRAGEINPNTIKGQG